MSFIPGTEVKMWTKDDIKVLIRLWEDKTTEEIADIIGRSRSSVIAMSHRVREAGYPLPRKRKKNSQHHLIKAALEDYKANG